MLQLRHQSPTRLEIRCYSLWARAAAWGLILIGLVLLVSWGQVVSLHCTRLGPAIVSCDYRAGWLGLPGQAETVEVRGVELAGSDSLYTVNLITAGDKLTVTRVWAMGYQRQRDLVVQINEFLADWQQSTITIPTFHPWWRYLLLPAPLFAGLLLWSLLPTVTLALQKQADLTIHRRTWWRRQTYAYPLSQIEAILLQPRPLRAPLLHLRPASLAAAHPLPGLAQPHRARLLALLNQF